MDAPFALLPTKRAEVYSRLVQGVTRVQNGSLPVPNFFPCAIQFRSSIRIPPPVPLAVASQDLPTLR
jgi:hypothetical protein